MQQPIRLLIYGYTIVLTAMVLLVLGINHYDNDETNITNAVLMQQLIKTDLVQELSSVTQKRTRFMQTTILTSNNLTNETYEPAYAQFMDSYSKTRLELAPLLSPRELEAILEVDRLHLKITEFGQQITVFFLNGSQSEASNILQQDVMPNTVKLIRLLSDMAKSIRMEVHKELLEASGDAREKNQTITIVGISAILLTLIVIALSVAYNRRVSIQNQDVDTYLEEKVLEATESLLDTQKELIEDNTLLARLASTDSLTGLFNRSHINDVLKKEHSRFTRHNQHFGIILLDIDHFKEVNDNYGHDVGDKALILLSSLLDQTVRNSDYSARWGGEEFMIVCTTINEADLFPIAENIRNLVDNTDFGAAGNLTVSLGCAIIEPNETVDELIKRADVALYAAKNNGRNQTVVSEFASII